MRPRLVPSRYAVTPLGSLVWPEWNTFGAVLYPAVQKSVTHFRTLHTNLKGLRKEGDDSPRTPPGAVSAVVSCQPWP